MGSEKRERTSAGMFESSYETFTFYGTEHDDHPISKDLKMGDEFEVIIRRLHAKKPKNTEGPSSAEVDDFIDTLVPRS